MPYGKKRPRGYVTRLIKSLLELIELSDSVGEKMGTFSGTSLPNFCSVVSRN